MAANGKEWNVSEESVDGMRGLADSMNETAQSLKDQVANLRTVYEDNEGGLGAHSADIAALLEELCTLNDHGAQLVNKLSYRLLKSAAVRQAHIESKPYGTGEGGGAPLATAAFLTDIAGLKTTMSLGSGDASVKQLSGAHKDVQKQDGPGYESHHIPSAAVLEQFGVDTKQWPTIALTKEDHAKTDSYRGKQQRKIKSIFPDSPEGGTYKEEATALIERGGGLFELIRDEIYNIREQCGDKYDGAIAQYLDEVAKYIEKNGVPGKRR